MKFKEFVRWHNKQVNDGTLDMNHACICANFMSTVRAKIFGRNKLWKSLWPEIAPVVAYVNRRNAAQTGREE